MSAPKLTLHKPSRSSPVENAPLQGGEHRATEVKKLKPPPEIWELVHPVAPQQFEARKAFAARFGSRWWLYVLLACSLGAAAGIGSTLWTLRAKLNQPPIPPSTQAKPATSAESIVSEPKPVAASESSDVTPIESSTLTPKPSDPLGAGVAEPVGSSTSRFGKAVSSRTPSHNERVREESAKEVVPEKKVEVQQTAQVGSEEPKKSIAGKEKAPSSTASSQQLIRPLERKEPKKAKVIDWP